MDETRADNAAGVDPRFGGIQEATAGAWTAMHYDRILQELESRELLPAGSAEELAVGWPAGASDRVGLLHEAKEDKNRTAVLAKIHPLAPGGYAFAEEVERFSGPPTGEVLQWMNNAPLHWTPDVAASLLIQGSEPLGRVAAEDPSEYAVIEGEVSELIRHEFENLKHLEGTGQFHTARTLDRAAQAENGGRRTAQLAIEHILEYEQQLHSDDVALAAQQQLPFDPRTGIAAPSGAASTGSGPSQADRANHEG